MSCQVQSAQKRKRQDAAEIEVLQRKASQVDSVKAARTKAKEHRSKANARIEKGLASGGAELEPMAKSRALRSDANGEMIDVHLHWENDARCEMAVHTRCTETRG